MRSRWLPVVVALSVPSAALAQGAPRIEGGPWRPELSLDPNALPYVEGTLVPGAAAMLTRHANETSPEHPSAAPPSATPRSAAR